MQRVEEYIKDSDNLLAKMVYLRGKLCSFDAAKSRDRDEIDLESYCEAGTELAETAHRVLTSGRNLVSAMSRESSQDFLDTVQQIHAILDSIELEQVYKSYFRINHFHGKHYLFRNSSY